MAALFAQKCQENAIKYMTKLVKKSCLDDKLVSPGSVVSVRNFKIQM